MLYSVRRPAQGLDLCVAYKAPARPVWSPPASRTVTPESLPVFSGLHLMPHGGFQWPIRASSRLPLSGDPQPLPSGSLSLPSVPLSSLQPRLDAASAAAGDERMKKRCVVHTAEYYAATKKGAILPCETMWKSLCTTPGLISTSPCSCSGVPEQPSEFNLRESAGCSLRCGGWNVGGKHISGARRRPHGTHRVLGGHGPLLPMTTGALGFPPGWGAAQQ